MYKLNQKYLILLTLSIAVIAVLSSVLYVTYNRRKISQFCCSHEIKEAFIVFGVIENVPKCSAGDWSFNCVEMVSIRQEFIPIKTVMNVLEYLPFMHNSTHHAKGFTEKSSKLHVNHTVWDEPEYIDEYIIHNI